MQDINLSCNERLFVKTGARRFPRALPFRVNLRLDPAPVPGFKGRSSETRPQRGPVSLWAPRPLNGYSQFASPLTLRPDPYSAAAHVLGTSGVRDVDDVYPFSVDGGRRANERKNELKPYVENGELFR